MTRIKSFFKTESGATSVEYAIMLALIAAVCIIAIISTGDSAGGFWGDNANSVENALTK